MSSEVKVPTFWANRVSEATIGQWLKQPGEAVKADEPIASLETDKVAIEVMAPDRRRDGPADRQGRRYGIRWRGDRH